MTDGLKFEQAIAELEVVVEQLQRPELPLDEAIALFRKGTELAAETETLLSGAELQIQLLTQAVQERFAHYALDSGSDQTDDSED